MISYKFVNDCLCCKDNKRQKASPNVVEKKGVGSVWNKGNFHWEERNYTQFAKKFLTEEICKVKVENPIADVAIEIYEVKELEGTASVTIRKQKQLFMFNFEGEFYFKAKSLTDENETMMGRIQVHEFNQEDNDIEIEPFSEKSGAWA